MKNYHSDKTGLDTDLINRKNDRVEKIKKHVNSAKLAVPPLMCWDIYYTKYQMILKRASIHADLKALQNFIQKYKWGNDLSQILQSNQYQALVLTDIAKRILWVNQGFTEMTGYPKLAAIDQTPAFLQGENTSEATKIEIRNKLKLMKPFKVVTINYRKDKSRYKCELSIFPLVGDNSFHFLALERDVA